MCGAISASILDFRLVVDPTNTDISHLLEISKTVIPTSGWRDAHRSGALELRSSLISDGTTILGAELCLRCLRSRPDERVSLLILMETGAGPRCIARIDWRASVPHINLSPLCGDLQFSDAGTTHFHNPGLYEGIENPLDFIMQNLPLAASIDPPPEDFSSLLDRSAIMLNITNLSQLAAPPWQTPSTFL